MMISASTIVFIAIALAAAIVGILVVRKIVIRRRRKAQDEDLPMIFMPTPKLQRPLADPDAPQADREASPVRASFAPARRELVSMPPVEEGTLQLLPGRLEIASGNDRMKEIRFVKTPGLPVVTFGRFAGEVHTHVQVDSPTVSRLHASMRFASGRWLIKNLSETNPVVVNGRQLTSNGFEHTLNDGDQVEMGDVIFLFRSR